MEQPPHRVEQFQKTIGVLNVKNPDIEAKQQVLHWMEAYTKVMAVLQAGQQPDLTFTILHFTTAVKASGAVKPVDDIIKALNDKYKFINQLMSWGN